MTFTPFSKDYFKGPSNVDVSRIILQVPKELFEGPRNLFCDLSMPIKLDYRRSFVMPLGLDVF